MSIQISDRLIQAAKNYDAFHTKNAGNYKLKEKEVQTKKSQFETAFNGLLHSIDYTYGLSVISSNDIKYIFENLKKCEKAQQKMIDWYSKFIEKNAPITFDLPEENSEATSEQPTPDGTILLGMEFDVARDELRTIPEYNEERKLRKEFKHLLKAETEAGVDFERIRTDLQTRKVSKFILDRADAFSKKKDGPAVKKYQKAAFLEFIKS